MKRRILGVDTTEVSVPQLEETVSLLIEDSKFGGTNPADDQTTLWIIVEEGGLRVSARIDREGAGVLIGLLTEYLVGGRLARPEPDRMRPKLEMAKDSLTDLLDYLNGE